MAVLPMRSQSAIVSNIAAGMQGRASSFLNFAAGSIFLVIAQAVSGVLLWLQAMALQIAKLTRLATSFGADVDSFIADFFDPADFARLGARAATGPVVFGRYTASAAAPIVLVGTTIKTQDGSQAFQVYADPANPAYLASVATDPATSAAIGGYVMAPQVTSVVAPVISVTAGPSGKPGSNGNVAAGAISLIASQATGIDTVTNPASFTNGSDQESDPALKVRFRREIASLSKGTIPAIKNAIASLELGLQVKVRSNENRDGSFNPGLISVFVDDGSGALTDDSLTLDQCRAAADGVRAGSIRVGVYAATEVFADVVAVIEIKTGYAYQTVVAQASAAVAANIDATGLGNDLQFYDTSDWIKAVPGVAKLKSLTLNGLVAQDIAGSPSTTIKAGNVDIS